MSNIQTALKPSTNITLIIFSGLIISVSLFNLSTIKLFCLLFGLVFGILGGIVQVLSFQESPTRFIMTGSMMEMRNVLVSTTWGQKYIRLYWIGNTVFVILQLYFGGNLPINFLIMHFAFLFIREMITLKTTFSLQKIIANK
jgi:hypothetical protein